jgi:hypothetical protein
MDVRSRGNCVSESIVNAEEWTAKTGLPAKIAIFKTDVAKNRDHSQAYGIDKGKYVPLTRHHSDGVLRKWTPHFPMEPYRYVELEDFIAEQEKVE